MSKFTLTNEISKLETSIKKISKKKSTAIPVERYKKLKKKLKKCEKKLNDYRVILQNPKDYADIYDDEETDSDNDKKNDKFNEYIDKLRMIKKKCNNDDFNIDDDINNYVDSTAMINWCNNYIKSQKMNWKIIK